MSVEVEWLTKDESLPPHCMLMAALPGVGNVGKLFVDTMIESLPSRKLARILHPDLLPHAMLSGNGLLSPPHLSLDSVELPDGKTVVTFTGAGQPLTPRGQHEVACLVLDLAHQSGCPLVLVLAGLSAQPGESEVHMVCASAEYRDELQAKGLAVSVEQPAGGMIGLAGLLASLSTWKGVNAAACITSTIGTSVDVQAADRLARWVSDAFELGLELPIDNTRETAARLLSLMEGKEIAGIDLSEEDAGAAFYA
jgi:proteasome assembly chaperone (PAC2) family protein